MTPRRCALLVVAALVAGAFAPSARAAIPAPPSQWYGLPGLNAASGAQWVRAIAYGTPPNVVYAGLEGGGVFRSTNGGATWSAFNSGFPNPLITNVRALLTSSTGTTVYAGTDDGIYKSTGGAWQPLAQGSEADPGNPKKLNQSVQSLLSLTGSSTMLAGVFSGGVYKSPDGGSTWQPPAPGNGMPSWETVYGLTSNVPGVVYATAGSGVYVSLDQGSSWTRISDGIPGSASPITTWAYPQKPQILFTSTGSNGIYRSLNAGLTWSPINAGLGAVRARGFQVFTATQGAHLYAATEDGLWEALHANSFIAPAPRWRQVTQDGLIEPGASNVIMWSLTAPVIPGAGAFGLIAGTQSNGGYFLGFEPPDSTCPNPNPSNTTSACPRLSDTTPTEGQTLSALNGTWTGTAVISYAYQWERCTDANNCAPIADAEESTYVVPDQGTAYRYRVRITATNPAPTFDLVSRTSAVSAPTAPNPDNLPGANQIFPPDITVLSPGETTAPKVGDTMYADDGTTPNPPINDGFFNPPATSRSFRWLRCNSSGTDCNEISGATQRSYTLQREDGTRELKVRVTGTNAAGTTQLLSSASYDVESSPAAIGAPLAPDEPGGAPKSQAPSIAGDAYVGETLAGSVGGWQDPTTDFLRRWVRCDAGGGSCTYIQKVASTDPEDDPTYTIRAGDAGSTLRMRVTADVNNDLTPDGLDNFLPHAVEIDTPPTAVVTTRPVPGGPPPPPPPGGGGGEDTIAPVLGALGLSRKTIVAGKRAVLTFTTSEGGTARVVIARATRGRRVHGRCRPKTRRNRKRKACTFFKAVRTITKPGVTPGQVTLAFKARKAKRKLRPGRYRATITMLDAAGNASSPLRVTFRVVRRRS
jgi:photosystem II stability/assembly factor-like uncharacterized protein